ncbi:MAG TPA: Crp/Fnr family transcriptional regulator [Anaerolineales bacterium]|nr:Crp/Fnr family transcriptional regulator [Anaerolineales bacterium]
MKINPLDLRRVNVFKDATDEDLKLFVQKGIPRSIEDGEFFFFQGDPAAYAYVLVAGKAKLLQTNPAGQQVNLRTINEWQIFGALGAVRENATYPATAQALEPSTALAIESGFLKEMMQVRPYLSQSLMQLMTGYIMEMQERYRELATERVERRIALTVLRLAAQIGKRTDGNGMTVELPLSRQDVAEASGTTIFTVSRVLADWERQGIVEAGRERVLIRNPHGLVQISEGSGADQ